MISLEQFINDTKSKVIGFTDTNSLKGQCVTLIQEYIRLCYGVPFKARGNAKDWINTCNDIAVKTNNPEYGDIIIWGSNATSGGYGHIAIYIGGKEYYDQYIGKKAGYSTNSIKTSIKPVGYLKLNGDRVTDPVETKYNLTKLLKKGSKGSEVKKLQTRLIELGYSCGKYASDGIFGPATLSAVKSFQKKSKIIVDGIVGKNTAHKLNWLYQGK